MILPEKGYDVCILDVPWKYNDNKNNDPAMGGITYNQMSLKEIKALKIGEIMNKNSFMFFFCTVPLEAEGIHTEVIQAYGFKPLTLAFNWIKLNQNAEKDLIQYQKTIQNLKKAYTDGNYCYCKKKCKCVDGEILDLINKLENGFYLKSNFYSGIGHYTAGNSEQCWLAKKGKPHRVRKDIKELLIAPRQEHSAKPNIELRRRIVDLVGEFKTDKDLNFILDEHGNKVRNKFIDIFARKPKTEEEIESAKNWTLVGNEIDGLDIRVALENLKNEI